MFLFYDKYNTLQNKLTIGEIIKPQILNKISNKKAIVNIKGYRVILESESIDNIDEKTKFVITGFNNKEKVITLKMLKLPEKEFKFQEFISEFILKYKIPLNFYTLYLAEILYANEEKLDYQHLKKLIQFLKYSNDFDLIFHLFRLKIDENFLIKILKIFTNINPLLKKFLKSDKLNEDWNSTKKWYNIIRRVDLNALLQFKTEQTESLYFLLKLYNVLNYLSRNEFSVYIPVKFSNEIRLIKYKYQRSEKNPDLIFLNIEVPFGDYRVIYFIKYMKEEFMSIRVYSENNDILQSLKANISELENKLKRIIKCNLSINFSITKSKNELDIYI